MLALILDRTHHVLLRDGKLPEFSPRSARPLQDVEHALAEHGIKLPYPAGSRALSPTPARDFAFVVDRASITTPSGWSWKVFRDLAADDTIWRLYVELMLGGWEPPTREVDVWSFGNEPEMAARLAHLVTCGAKRVTMGWIDALEKSGTPQAYENGFSIVTDGFGFPRVALRSVEVRAMRFDEVPASAAAGEGEGDLTYDDWRDGHVKYFTDEAARYGLTFDGNVRIAVERFEIVRLIG